MTRDSASKLTISWVTPVIFLIAASLSLLPYRQPFRHPHLVLLTALGMAIGMWWGRGLVLTRRTHLAYAAVQLIAITVIVGGSNGVRSPLVMLYLVFVLECSVAYGNPGGILSATAAVACLSASEVAAPSMADVDRLVATYPFFLLVGLLTGVLADAMRRQQDGLAAERARHEAQEERRELQLSIARDIQQALLPRGNPCCQGWEVSWRLEPQQAVGGDFVQFVEGEETLGCILADVTGKGIGAALVTGSLHQMAHRYGLLPPHDAVTRMNRDLCDSTPAGISVSMVLLRIQPDGDVLVANAGHPYPLVVRRGQDTIEAWKSCNLLAGWFAEAGYDSYRQHLEPGDTLLLYTDGLTDSFTQQGERVGETGVESLFQEGRALPLDALAAHLLEPVRRGRQVDDVTLLLLRRTASSSTSAAADTP